MVQEAKTGLKSEMKIEKSREKEQHSSYKRQIKVIGYRKFNMNDRYSKRKMKHLNNKVEQNKCLEYKKLEVVSQ